MTLVILALVAVLGAAILAAVAATLLLLHGLPLADRLALSCLAGGLLWGGLCHIRGQGLGLGDVVFLAGVALLLWRFLVRHPSVPIP